MKKTSADIATLLGPTRSQEDPGESIRELAERLGLSERATYERVRKQAGKLVRGAARRNGRWVSVWRVK